MTGCRWVVAGCLLFAIQWLTRKRTRELPRRAEVGRAALTAVLLIVGGNGLLCVAEQHVESGTAALIIAGTPIWMVSIDSIFGRKAPTGSVIAGLLVGLIGYLGAPQVMGAGYEAIDQAMHAQFAWKVLLLLALFKIIATTLSFSSGTPGGMFAPSQSISRCISGISLVSLVRYCSLQRCHCRAKSH